MHSHARRGVTLVEIVVAVAVFVLAIGGVLSSIFSIVYLSEVSKNSTLATSDLKNMMERIRATPFDHITADFPNADQDGTVAHPYQTIVGGYTLRSEHITVTYANPNADPLEIRVAAAWQDSRGRGYSASMSTFRTR